MNKKVLLAVLFVVSTLFGASAQKLSESSLVFESYSQTIAKAPPAPKAPRGPKPPKPKEPKEPKAPKTPKAPPAPPTPKRNG